MNKKSIIIALSAIIFSVSANATSQDTCKALASLSGVTMDYRQSDRSILTNMSAIQEVTEEKLESLDPNSEEYKLNENIGIYMQASLRLAYLKPYYNIPKIDLKIKNDFISDSYFKCLQSLKA